MLLLALAVLTGALLIVLPVWLAAKLFRARRSGFLRCFLAALLSSLAFQLVSWAIGIYLGMLPGMVAMAAIYQIVLRMGFWGGLGVAIGATLLQALVYGLVMVALGELLGADSETTAPAGTEWTQVGPPGAPRA